MTEQDGETIPLASFRVPRATLEKLDAWLADLNAARRGRKLSRNDLIRGLLDWAADEHPDWEHRPAAAPGCANLPPEFDAPGAEQEPPERFIDPTEAQVEQPVPPKKGTRR
jgi:hypothetical protein